MVKATCYFHTMKPYGTSLSMLWQKVSTGMLYMGIIGRLKVIRLCPFIIEIRDSPLSNDISPGCYVQVWSRHVPVYKQEESPGEELSKCPMSVEEEPGARNHIQCLQVVQVLQAVSAGPGLVLYMFVLLVGESSHGAGCYCCFLYI